jgi:hypothetical protein
MNFLVKENIRSHSADINGIDSKSNAIFESRGYFSRRISYHSNGRLHDVKLRRQYFAYSSRMVIMSQKFVRFMKVTRLSVSEEKKKEG